MGLRDLCWAIIIINGIASADGSSCRQLCEDKENVVCSEGLPCTVIYDESVPWGSKSLSTVSSFEATYFCQISNGSNDVGLGLEVSWEINGSYLEEGKVEKFELTILDVKGMSSLSTAYTVITPNPNSSNHGKIKFFYDYDGNPAIGPSISENAPYKLTLITAPTHHRSEKHLAIPYNFFSRHCVTNETVVTPEAPTEIPKILVVCVAMAIIFLIVFCGASAACIWKKRQHDAQALNASRQHHILVLLNVDDKSKVAKQTNWTATALSRAKLGDVTVKYNRWETTEIADKGIIVWLHEKVTWANKIIISSTPDSQRNSHSAVTFERALDKILPKPTTTNSDEETKPVFVIYFEERDKYTECPYMNNDRYRKFHLENEWTELCRCIHGCPGSEHEPLYNGNHF